MKNMMTKSTFKEIAGSFSRWAAILAIVALGVGFFSGLKISKDAFILTGDKYVRKHNLFDYQLISTLGFEKDNIEEIMSVDGVTDAEGSYSTDAIVHIDGDDSNERVAKLHTITDNINTLSLKAGKMPSEADQCIGDAEYFSEDDIGKKIKIVTTSGEDDASGKMLKYDEYTLTGIADSVLYLNFERGSTSLGNGSVAMFLFMPEQSWDSEFYTEMYVSIDNNDTIFSDSYNDAVKSMKAPLTDALENCANSRYDEIISEANEKLEDAEKELDDARKELSDGEREIAENEKKIADGEREIREKKQSIKDAEQKLADARMDYNDGLEKYNEEKESAYARLEPLKQAVEQAAGTPLYQQYKEQYDTALAQTEAQLKAAADKLEQAKTEITAGEAELADGKSKIRKAEAELADGKRELASGKAELASAKSKILDAQEELDDARDEVEDIENPDTYVLDRTSNIGYVCFESDSDIVEGIAKVFPVFFFIVAALVVMTTMTRMVDEQRTQIGVLKALGYSKGRILSKYLFYSSSAALIGGILGFYIGSYLFPGVIWQAYGMMYGFAPLSFVIDLNLGGLSVLASLVCAAGATLYSCYKEFNEVPAELIRPKAPAMGKRILLERVHFIWDRLKFLHKVSLRNIFRYKKRFFMMILGVCGCTALLVTGLGIRDSIKNVVSAQYDKIYHVDYTVTFDKELNEAEKDEFIEENSSIISDCMFLYTISVDARANNKVKSINMVVCEDESPIRNFIDLHDENGGLEYPGTDECIINDNLAEQMGLKVGDTITISDSDMGEMEVKITGLCENYVYNYIYINEATFEKNWGDMEMNSAFVLGRTNEDGEVENPHEDGAYLMNADNVASVSVTYDFRDRIDNMMKNLNYIIALVVICAALLAFIVLYNLTNINITERIREIATIKVLGFYPKETSAYVFRENIILTAISAIVGLPLGKALHAFVMSQVKINLLSFDIHIEPVSYLLAVAATFLFALIVNFALYFKLNNISMTESLKSIE